MANLNEYKIEIKNDEDLAKWKSTWNGIDPVPEEVHRYMRMIVLPRIARQNSEFINSIFQK